MSKKGEDDFTSLFGIGVTEPTSGIGYDYCQFRSDVSRSGSMLIGQSGCRGECNQNSGNVLHSKMLEKLAKRRLMEHLTKAHEY